jgi:hypothetical protein
VSAARRRRAARFVIRTSTVRFINGAGSVVFFFTGGSSLAIRGVHNCDRRQSGHHFAFVCFSSSQKTRARADRTARRAVGVARHSRGARGFRAPGRRADAVGGVRIGGGRARSPRSRLASRGHRFEETTYAMAGARKDRRSRGSGDSGDTPSGERAGNDGAGTVASGTDWETPEVLAAMNDTDFASAVHRAVASHRKIFVNQERNWAAVRLRANLMPARVAAERARQGLGASGRVRARSKPVRLKPVRAGDARDERVGDVAHRGEMASVVVKRFAKKGASAETRRNRRRKRRRRLPRRVPPGARSASARIQVKTRLQRHRVFLRSRKSRR